MAYATRAQLEAIFATTDVATWADRTNNKDVNEIAANISEALDQATADIDDLLRGGVYKVPFVIVPRYIMDCCRKLAAYNLYLPRGSQDADEQGKPANRLAPMRNEVLHKLRSIRACQVQLDLDQIAGTHPFVVNQTLHREQPQEFVLLNGDPFEL